MEKRQKRYTEEFRVQMMELIKAGGIRKSWRTNLDVT